MGRKSAEFELRKMHECRSSKKIRKEITNGGDFETPATKHQPALRLARGTEIDVIQK